MQELTVETTYAISGGDPGDTNIIAYQDTVRRLPEAIVWGERLPADRDAAQMILQYCTYGGRVDRVEGGGGTFSLEVKAGVTGGVTIKAAANQPKLNIVCNPKPAGRAVYQ
ncbi:MAG: hypothetical protein ACK5TK_07635 [Betaproteobacteria bacterium]